MEMNNNCGSKNVNINGQECLLLGKASFERNGCVLVFEVGVVESIKRMILAENEEYCLRPCLEDGYIDLICQADQDRFLKRLCELSSDKEMVQKLLNYYTKNCVSIRLLDIVPFGQEPIWMQDQEYYVVFNKEKRKTVLIEKKKYDELVFM